MNHKVFINEALTTGLERYIEDSKRGGEFKVFSVEKSIVAMLIFIFGESNIINPYLINSKFNLYKNINLHNISTAHFDLFLADFNLLHDYIKTNIESDMIIKPKTTLLTRVNEELIDFYITTRKNHPINETNITNFSNLLYTPNCPNPTQKLLNVMICKEPTEVLWYWNIKQNELRKKVVLTPISSLDLLSESAYNIMGLSIDEVASKSPLQVNDINNQILKKFNINSSVHLGRNEKLDAAIKASITNHKVSSGKINRKTVLLVICICLIASTILLMITLKG